MNFRTRGLSEETFSQIKGKIIFDKPMKSITWLGVGGLADIFFQPKDLNDLCEFLCKLPEDFSVIPVGVCSNILVRDGGIPGATIRLGRGFSEVKINGQYITAGGFALDSKVAEFAAELGVDLSFLRTIPGTIGGAVKMNAGCYGTCLADVLESCEIVTRTGETKVLNCEDLQFSYRNSNLQNDAIVTSVVLKGKKAEPENIKKAMFENKKKRFESQPSKEKTGGSTFKNPKKAHKKLEVLMSAWQLIDMAGLRGKKLRGAQVSELHSNFLINLGHANAEDFEALGELIQEKVYVESGVNLQWEIKKVGLRNKFKQYPKNLESSDA